MVPRKALAALIVPALLTGCAAGSGGRLSVRPETRPQTSAVAIEPILARNNQNAEHVERLYAKTSLSGHFSRFFSGGADGELSMERDRNFRLRVEKPFSGSTLADLGSNDKEFWFWSRDSKDREILVGEYGVGGTLPQDIPFQPDWIVEAFGLRVTPADERVEVARSQDPNTIVVVHHRDDGRGSTTIKRTYYDRATYRVKMHEFFSKDGRQPLAVVTPSDYRALSLEAGPDGGAASNVVLPHRIRVQLASARDPKDKVDFTLMLRDGTVKLNPAFTQTYRDDNFTVPKYEGYARRYLTDPPAYAADSSARSYESRPVPAAGSGTELGEPQPMEADGVSLRWDDPMPLESDLPSPSRAEPLGVESIVRAGVPAAPDGATQTTRPRERRVSLGTGFDR